MHIDARELPEGIIEGDLCIVGAGAAGLTMALEWIDSPWRVVLLEGGGFEYDDRIQELFRGRTTGQPYFPLKSTRLHYFGGTTGHWGGFCALFDPIDFAQRDWVPHSGWPITLDDLLPFYPRAHTYLDLGPCDYTVDYWQARNPGFVPLELPDGSLVNKVWRFSPPTRYGPKYRDAIVGARNIELYTYASLVDISATESVNAVRELVVRNYTGRVHRVRARCFVLACNAIQNARVLLAANRQARHGLGNDYDNVGRFFMEHVELKSGELWLDRVRPMNFYLRNRQARLELALSPEAQTEHRILNGSASLVPLGVARKLAPVIDTWSSDDPRESRRVMHADQQRAGTNTLSLFPRFGYRRFELETRLEQAPNPSSRITLDEERDELGVPRAALNWVLTPLEKRSIRTLYQLMGRTMGLADVGRVRLMDYLRDEQDDSWPAFTGGGWHHTGTTRMSHDPKLGVVDSDCRVFGLANLYVAGASCFSTSGAVNPTLTLVALSIRLSDHLKQVLGTEPPLA